MTPEDLEDLLPLKVLHVGVNGKRTFDPRGKRLLIEACQQPGASVAGLALKAGVNVNQLRNWIALDEARREGSTTSAILPAPTAFIPVVEVDVAEPRRELMTMEEHRPAIAEPTPAGPPPLARLSPRLPNGTTVDLQCASGDAALVAAMVKALGAR
jgi:transposase